MNAVCRFIKLIEDITNEDYDYYLGYILSKIYFKNGGCYELVKTLAYFLPTSEIWLSNDFKHCVIKYKGILYDIDGIIENNNDYHKADEDDMTFLNDEMCYGRIEIKFNKMKPSDALIRNILDSRNESLIEECQNIDDNPDYYNQKKLIKNKTN